MKTINMKEILFSLCVIMFIGCNRPEYKYIQVFDGEEYIEQLYVDNDTIAYKIGYNIFANNKRGAIKKYNKLAIDSGYHTIKPHTYEYKILRDSIDITDIEFVTKQEYTEYIDSVILTGITPIIIDSVKINELKPYFSEKYDPYKVLTWIEPKSSLNTNYYGYNGAYCYFQIDQKQIPSNFRFVLRIDDYINIQKCTFLIDGVAWDYVPYNTDGGYRDEYFDEQIKGTDEILLISQISLANEVSVRCYGTRGTITRKLTKQQIKDIKRTLDYYVYKGGELFKNQFYN